MATTIVSERPAGKPSRPYTFPPVVRYAAHGGTIVAADMPGYRMAFACLVLEAGSCREPQGKEGVARIVQALLKEGTQTRDGAAFALAMESLGTSLTGGVGAEVMRLAVNAPGDRLTEAVTLLAEAVRTPLFAEAGFDRIRGDMVSEMKQMLANPGVRPIVKLYELFYAADSRFSTMERGSVEGLEAVTLDDVKAFHAERLAAGGTLVIVGDLAQLDLDALALTAFGDAEATASAETPYVGEVGHTGREIIIFDRPGAAQSVMLAAHHAPTRDAADATEMSAVSRILGGGHLASRLNLKLREEKGYTYGASGTLDLERYTGLFYTKADVQTDKTAPALADMLAEIEKVEREGVTEDEVRDTRTAMNASLPIKLQTPGAVGPRLVEIVVYGLADDHVTQEYARVEALTKAQLDAVAAKRIDSANLLVLIEGDAALIREEIEALGLAPVTVIDAEKTE